MNWSASRILEVLDSCCKSFRFPALDNGYVYPAATRLTAYRSDQDWHLAIEVFGFSPRAGIPDINVYHFGSNVVRLKHAENFVSPEAYESYLENNPYNEMDFIYPIEEGDWIDPATGETVVQNTSIAIRGEVIPVPAPEDYATLGIELQDPAEVHIYELCRALAVTHAASIQATEAELRRVVSSDLKPLLRLDEWHHPDVLNPAQVASNSETFQQIAAVLESGDVSAYAPGSEPNTHWSNWPDGGQL